VSTLISRTVRDKYPNRVLKFARLGRWDEPLAARHLPQTLGFSE
jgi:hypothetical protein